MGEFLIRDMQSLKSAVEELCRYLTEQGVTEERIFDSRLVANELLGNVLKHAQSNAKLHYTVEEEHVRITVYSNQPFMPPKQSVCSDVYSEHGRGLFLVDSVCVERTVTGNGGIAVYIKRQ